MARLAQARSEAGLFAPAAVDVLFDDIGLPRPAKTSNILASLEKKKLLTRVKKGQGGAAWKLTPEGTGQAAGSPVIGTVLGAVHTGSRACPLKREKPRRGGAFVTRPR